MNGISMNTKDTVIVLDLLVVEEMCINAIGAKLRGVHLFPMRLHVLSPGLTAGRSQPP